MEDWYAEYFGGDDDQYEACWCVRDEQGALVANYLTEADAKLISAAPSMLAVLKRLRKSSKSDQWEKLSTFFPEWDDAIEKAEG